MGLKMKGKKGRGGGRVGRMEDEGKHNPSLCSVFTKHPHMYEALSKSGHGDNGRKDRWMGRYKVGRWITGCWMGEQVDGYRQ